MKKEKFKKNLILFGIFAMFIYVGIAFLLSWWMWGIWACADALTWIMIIHQIYFYKEPETNLPPTLTPFKYNAGYLESGRYLCITNEKFTEIWFNDKGTPIGYYAREIKYYYLPKLN